ncbi:MAG: DUF2793 domain-containing protein, partial [Pseudorhodoplanes sp.]
SAPGAGWVAYVIDEEILVAWDGDSWNAASAGEGGGGGDAPTELQNLSLLGVGATADAVNPLSAKLNNVLWAARTVAEGGDGTLRYKMSKESADKVLSVLFQDNFSGRAEIGLTGDDDFHFKVSPDGSSWLEAIRIDHATGRISFPSGGVREVLAANRTYYVRSDGSDSNNGLSNTSGGAFATIQHAYDVIVSTLDLGGKTVTIQCNNATFTAGLLISQPWTGGGAIILDLGGGTLSTTSASCVRNNAPLPGLFTVQNGTLTTTTSGHGIFNNGVGAIQVGNSVTFGAVAQTHMQATGTGVSINVLNNTTISGGAQAHYSAQNFGLITDANHTITISASISITNFAATSGGSLQAFGNTYSLGGNTVTGARFSSSANGVIFTNGGGANYFPGSSAGSGTNPGTSPFGLYN